MKDYLFQYLFSGLLNNGISDIYEKVIKDIWSIQNLCGDCNITDGYEKYAKLFHKNINSSNHIISDFFETKSEHLIQKSYDLCLADFDDKNLLLSDGGKGVLLNIEKNIDTSKYLNELCKNSDLTNKINLKNEAFFYEIERLSAINKHTVNLPLYVFYKTNCGFQWKDIVGSSDVPFSKEAIKFFNSHPEINCNTIGGIEKSTKKLMINEANIATNKMEHDMYMLNPLVVGKRIQLQGSHTTTGGDGNVVPLQDMCNDLVGNYPKEFVFTGWHPNCRCVQSPIFAKDSEVKEFDALQKIGKQIKFNPKSKIVDLPDNFKKWYENNISRIDNAKIAPLFYKNNEQLLNKLISLPVSQSVINFIDIQKKFLSTCGSSDAFLYNLLNGINYTDKYFASFNINLKGYDKIFAKKELTDLAKTVYGNWIYEHEQTTEYINLELKYNNVLTKKGFALLDGTTIDDTILQDIKNDYKNILDKLFSVDLSFPPDYILQQEDLLNDKLDNILSKLLKPTPKTQKTKPPKVQIFGFDSSSLPTNPNYQFSHNVNKYSTVFIENDKKIINDLMIELNVDEQTAKDYAIAVNCFSWCWDYEIKQVQYGKATKDLEKYQHFEDKLRGQYHKLEDIKKHEENLEKYIASAPQWNGGTTYRGMAVTKRVYKKIISNLTKGYYSFGATTSWSTNELCAKMFSRSNLHKKDYNGQKTNTSIIFVVNGSHNRATSIKHLSAINYEEEVLSSKNSLYKLVKVEEIKDQYGAVFKYIYLQKY